MSLTLMSCEVELEMDLKTQSDLKELKFGAGIEPGWKTRSWPASQEQKFQRPAAIGFWENLVFKKDSRFGEACSFDFLYGLKLLQRRCCQDLREQGLLLLQYRKARCWDLKSQGLHQRRHCDMFIGTLLGMFIGDAAPVWIIGTLPGMFIRDTAPPWIIGKLPGMVSSGRYPTCWF